MKKFKDVISDLPIEKQQELIEWRKKANNRSSILITFLVVMPIEVISFISGHYIGCWLH